jgi:hypothetical protein
MVCMDVNLQTCPYDDCRSTERAEPEAVGSPDVAAELESG